MVDAALSYEEKRKQRLEENKKRMEELNLHKLSMSLKSTPKSSPAKKVKPKTVDFAIATPPRRSSRTIDKPPPNYKEDALEPLGRGRRVYNYKTRDLSNRVYANAEDRAYAIQQAEKLEENLGSEYPTCIKPMLQSHVTGGFWLSLPLPFCKTNLPSEDDFVTLVDENDDKWETKYLVGKNGLSGGWRGFAIDHELVDGDCLIFQSIGKNTLKVYIIRVNSSEDEDQDGNNNSGEKENKEDEGQSGNSEEQDGNNDDQNGNNDDQNGNNVRGNKNKRKASKGEDQDGKNVRGKKNKRKSFEGEDQDGDNEGKENKRQK